MESQENNPTQTRQTQLTLDLAKKLEEYNVNEALTSLIFVAASILVAAAETEGGVSYKKMKKNFLKSFTNTEKSLLKEPQKNLIQIKKPQEPQPA